jgi:asparagine synthase (glutamine-hydrolysing)
MHFLGAVIDWSAPASARPALERMAAARRAAGRDAPAWHDVPGGLVAVAGRAHAAATAGDVTVVLVHPELRTVPRAAELAGQTALACAVDPLRGLQDLPQPWHAVVVDARERRVLIAGDRFGIGPLYYWPGRDTLVASSDLDALVAHGAVPATISPQAIYDYLFFHCIPAPRTIYRDVAKLDPATVVAWEDGKARVHEAWHPRFAARGAPVPEHRVLRERLEAAVAARGQGRVGAFLSGGLDSSTVAGMLARQQPGASSFTIGFDAEGYDESGYARISANHFATSHNEYVVTPRDVVETWPALARHYGEPFGNSSVMPTYHCAHFAAGKGFDALLAGDGGDELFGGNKRYVDQEVFEKYFRVPALFRWAVETGYQLLPFITRLEVGRRGASYIRQAKLGVPDRLQWWNFLNRFPEDQLFEDGWIRGIDTQLPRAAWRARYAQAGDVAPLHAMLYLDWKYTLADNDLVKVNAMCDLAGIDVRYPMLDAAVVDYSTTIPAAAMVPQGRLRGFYKDAMQGFLPQAVIDKSKHGFGLPFGVWMRDDPALNDMAESALRAFAKRGIIRPDFIDHAIGLLRGDAPGYYGELIWILVTLEFWLSRPAAPAARMG